VLERFIDRFARFGLRPEALTPVYGLAEATLAVTFSPLRERFRHRCFERDALVRSALARPAVDGQPLVSLGRPLPGFALRIVDEDGEALAEGRLGRVLVRGPSTMLGYLGLPEATAAALQGGWLDTGDTGFLHDGELYLYGRAEDRSSAGRNHAPQDVEQAIDGVEGVLAGGGAALGLLSERGEGEELVLFVERARDAAVADAVLAERVRRRALERTGLAPAGTSSPTPLRTRAEDPARRDRARSSPASCNRRASTVAPALRYSPQLPRPGGPCADVASAAALSVARPRSTRLRGLRDQLEACHALDKACGEGDA
jgi:acyl-CoA synthetase (AMP-forming)/AMP-acid ligase II